MPEFTWNGIVRHGFGFYNPNYAAALICAAFPFLLGWRRRPWIGILLAAALLVPLALTFSRTGLAVLVFESALLAVLKGGTARKTAVAAIALAIAVFGAFGVPARSTESGTSATRRSIPFCIPMRDMSSFSRPNSSNRHRERIPSSGSKALAFVSERVKEGKRAPRPLRAEPTVAPDARETA